MCIVPIVGIKVNDICVTQESSQISSILKAARYKVRVRITVNRKFLYLTLILIIDAFDRSGLRQN